jgi:hypothetical protein
MDRQRISVCTIVVLFLLTLPRSGSADTTSKTGLNKRTRTVTNSRTGSRANSSVSRTKNTATIKGCAPCAAQLAKRRKGRASSKIAKSSKSLPCHPKDYVDPKIAKSYKSALRDMKRAGIKPRVTSVWRSSESQAQLHRCSLSTRCRRSNPGLYRALPPGRSIHEAGFAVDIGGIATGPRGAKRLTPQGRRVVAIMKKNGFNWRYGLADPVHFEADPRNYGYRSVRQAIKRTQTTCQVKFAKTRTVKKPANKIASAQNRGPVKARLSDQATSTKIRHNTRKASA